MQCKTLCVVLRAGYHVIHVELPLDFFLDVIPVSALACCRQKDIVEESEEEEEEEEEDEEETDESEEETETVRQHPCRITELSHFVRIFYLLLDQSLMS